MNNENSKVVLTDEQINQIAEKLEESRSEDNKKIVPLYAAFCI